MMQHGSRLWRSANQGWAWVVAGFGIAVFAISYPDAAGEAIEREP
jgi:hypothetical protein